jgi:hypothetical protein
MGRHSLLLVTLMLAACGGGSTDPDEVVDSLDLPRLYQGTARFTRTTNGGLADVVSFVGEVRFGTTDRGQPPVDYTMVGGTMSVVHIMDLSSTCRGTGDASFDVKPGDGVIILFPGGRYSGHIRKEVRFTTTVSCRGVPGSYDIEDVASIDLEIEGTTVDGRMQGTMAPVRHTQSTFEGSWNFAPIIND